jgi:hypothetical protein
MHMRRRISDGAGGARARGKADARLTWRTLLGTAVAALSLAVQAYAADDLAVDVARLDDGRFAVRARALVHASRETAWKTLTDYGDLSRFVPGLDRSAIVSCAQGQCVVDQDWHVSVLWFSLPIAVTVRSVERPPGSIEVHLVRGELTHLDGGYLIGEPSGGRLELRWEGTLGSASRLPGWLSTALSTPLSTPFVRRMAREQFRGMVEEIERRERAMAEAPRPSGSPSNPAP